jgi:hypothetical protein
LWPWPPPEGPHRQLQRDDRGNPTQSDDFNFSGPHMVTATTWEKPGSENQVPVTVDLADAIGEIK